MKLDQKRYRPFRISKNIGLEVFQLELPEEWMIHNVFNEELLTRCNELQFKGQHVELHQQLIIKKKNTKLKKYKSIENEAEECNIWCIGKVMGISMTNGL